MTWLAIESLHTLGEMFTGKVQPDEHTGCWEWTACKNHKGYGSLHRGGRSLLAHRFAYEECCGPIPEGLQLDHLCMNRSCVNPLHLEPVTNAENQRRAAEAKTRCKRGHPLFGDNLMITSQGGRCCITCKKAKERDKYLRSKL